MSNKQNDIINEMREEYLRQMRTQKQTIFGKDGDCLRACVANILDLNIEDVPNFVENGNDRWELDFRDFCLSHGVFMAGDHFYAGKPWFNNCPSDMWLAFGGSPRGEGLGHCVIMNGRNVKHDPHPDNNGLTNYRSFYVPYFIEEALKRTGWAKA